MDRETPLCFFSYHEIHKKKGVLTFFTPSERQRMSNGGREKEREKERERDRDREREGEREIEE